MNACLTCWHWDFAFIKDDWKPQDGDFARSPIAPCTKVPEMEWGSLVYASGKEFYAMADFHCLLWDQASDEMLAERSGTIKWVNERRADAEVELIDVRWEPS